MPAGSTSRHARRVTDFELVGGAPVIRAVIDRFYELVLGDDRLSGYFEGADARALKRHQMQLVAQVMGGPVRYDGRALQLAHAGLNITSDHFGVAVTYLAAALQWAGVPSDIIARVGARLTDARREVVTTCAL